LAGGGNQRGRVFGGRYRGLDRLGHGGQGVVERALDQHHDRVVALKIRPVDATTDRQALLDEARVLLAVPPHPNIALVRADFFDGDNHVLVMDFVDGPNLATRLRERGGAGLPRGDVVRWLSNVADALDHLHGQQPPVVHGDVKPANIVNSRDGAVLVDFGLAATEAAGVWRPPTLPRLNSRSVSRRRPATSTRWRLLPSRCSRERLRVRASPAV
jgi:serine/threonine-protein kinase